MTFLIALKTNENNILTRTITANNQKQAVSIFYKKYPDCKIIAITLLED